ncbi:hypothetical protein NQ315_006713 [Exocentrus adspersus]|uniref:Uncharacterized protein n=1 Tax=Exocentrus adspersus TaxID=1586481 RepID=A0AAV8WC94_9CUCU|nr:hypothetical protein NQ315_006713 [Exocentrus adspersus]
MSLKFALNGSGSLFVTTLEQPYVKYYWQLLVVISRIKYANYVTLLTLREQERKCKEIYVVKSPSSKPPRCTYAKAMDHENPLLRAAVDYVH